MATYLDFFPAMKTGVELSDSECLVEDGVAIWTRF
jgi:hypothetical protein